MTKIPDPLEAFRLFLRSVIQWALYEPPGAAVSGELNVSFETAVAEDQPNTRSQTMAQAFPGQIGIGTVKILDKDGRETDNWDVAGGVQYTSSAPAVASVIDEDANPKDCQVTAHAVGQATFTCTFDGTVGTEQNMITLQAVVDVVQPPPGAATSGTFELVFEQVPTQA